jgi:hypothetical protein
MKLHAHWTAERIGRAVPAAAAGRLNRKRESGGGVGRINGTRYSSLVVHACVRGSQHDDEVTSTAKPVSARKENRR